MQRKLDMHTMVWRHKEKLLDQRRILSNEIPNLIELNSQMLMFWFMRKIMEKVRKGIRSEVTDY